MNFEKFILDFFDGVATVNFDIIIKSLGVILVIFWLFVVGWVFIDSRDRSQSRAFIILSVLITLVLNVPGLIIYLILRPKLTLSDQYWADLEKRYLLYETADLLDCSKCGYPLQPGFISCPNCKETIKNKCVCGVNIDKHWKFCPFCGASNVNNNVATTENGVEQIKSPGYFAKLAGHTRSRLSTLKATLAQKREERKAKKLAEKARKLEEKAKKELEKQSIKKVVKKVKKKKTKKSKK